MGRPDFENLRVYQLAEMLGNEIWHMVKEWDSFTKNTIGKQIVRSVDSIGANIAEGNGRYNIKDNQRFVKIAKGSLYETIHWLRQACHRNLVTEDQKNKLKPIVDELSSKLSAYLNSLQKKNEQ